MARWLGERPGVVVIDADRVARDVLAAGTPETAAVYARFGDELRRPDGELDRAALGRIVFSDPSALRDLEAIVHPAVRPRILAEVDAADAAGALRSSIEAIKLVEGGLADLCDEVWLVTCAPEVQLERLVGRGTGAGRRARSHRGPGRSGDAPAAGGDPCHRHRRTRRRRPVPGPWNGSTRPWPAPESSDRPGHTRRPGRSGGAPGQRRGDGGSAGDAPTVRGSVRSGASPSASGRGWRSGSVPGSGAVLRTTGTRPGSAARSG